MAMLSPWNCETTKSGLDDDDSCEERRDTKEYPSRCSGHNSFETSPSSKTVGNISINCVGTFETTRPPGIGFRPS